MEKININKEHRLKEINKLALLLQNTKLKSIREIRRISETIELLSNEKILIGLNNAIEDFKKGRYTILISDKEKGKNISPPKAKAMGIRNGRTI